MSITRFIEIRKKDQPKTDVYDNRWVGWKSHDLEYDPFEVKRRMEYLDEVRPEYIESFAENLKQLVLEVGEDEIMVYIDAGN